MSEQPPNERRGAGCIGLPAMIGALVIVAVVPNVYGVGGLLATAIAVVVLFLIIGLTMTIANRQ
jgi:uncharacterized membrane protein YkvI